MTKGVVAGIIANLVIVEADGPVSQNEICFIKLGDTSLMAEVIKVLGKNAYVQVFESTRNLRVGDTVEFAGHMLEATLGPGILSKNYDGLQNDLDKMKDVFLKRGEYTNPLEDDTEWEYKPLARVGDMVEAGSWLGEVKENWINHKIMVPFKFEGKFKVKEITPEGKYTIHHTVAVLEDADGKEHKVTMVQKWPVKVAIRAYKEKPRPFRMMETGIRCIDSLNPIVEGGTGFTPGPFGTGKTVLQHALSKHAEADLIIVAACGERANEVVEIFTEFPELEDPRSGRKLIERTRAWNPWTNFKGELSDKHLVRPIPQHEIDRSSPPITQSLPPNTAVVWPSRPDHWAFGAISVHPPAWPLAPGKSKKLPGNVSARISSIFEKVSPSESRPSIAPKAAAFAPAGTWSSPPCWGRRNSASVRPRCWRWAA